MRALVSPFLLVVTAIAGCGEKESVRTVEWYRSQDTERKAVIARCENNPGERALMPNCINAKQADNEKALSRRGWLAPDAANVGKDKD